jgi:hypothetical protein
MVAVVLIHLKLEPFRRDTVAGGFRYVRFLRKFDATFEEGCVILGMFSMPVLDQTVHKIVSSSSGAFPSECA